MATARRTGTGRARPPVAPPVVNGYSASPVPAPPKIAAPLPSVRALSATVAAGPAPGVRTGEPTKTSIAAHTKATGDLEKQRGVARKQKGFAAKRAAYEAAGGHPLRADTAPATPVGHGMTAHDFSAQGMLGAGVAAPHVLDAVRGTSMHADPAHIGTTQAGSGAKVPRTITQGTPDINQPHEVNPNVNPGRRWEDMHPHEQARTLARVREYGSSPEKMQDDLRGQVLSANARGGRNAVATPFSSLFYEGPSPQHSKIEQGADEVVAHPGFPAALGRQHARAVVAVGNSDTSPNVKFQQKDKYPNHEVAMASVQHALGGGGYATAPTPKEIGQAAYPTNIAKAVHHTGQMMQGATLGNLWNPPSEKTGKSSRAFDPTEAPKVTDYAGAWIDPTGPDSRYVSDVHSTHSHMPHLGTAKPVQHQHSGTGDTKWIVPGQKVPKGYEAQYHPAKEDPTTGKMLAPKLKTGKSETEEYLAGDKVGLSALHDHIARKVATDLGLSHSVDNAGATHYLQATDWGEEQIKRKDITDRTEAKVYGGDSHIPARGHDIAFHTPANSQLVGTPSARRSEHFAAGASTPATPIHDMEPEAPAVATKAKAPKKDRFAGYDEHATGRAQERQERAIDAISTATQRKRTKGKSLAERTAGNDPNARSIGW